MQSKEMKRAKFNIVNAAKKNYRIPFYEMNIILSAHFSSIEKLGFSAY
jgi:hypothetical protein